MAFKGSHLDLYRDAMQSMTRERVNAAVRKHLQYKDLQIVIVTKDAKALREALISDAPSPITYPTPRPAEVLREDQRSAVPFAHPARERAHRAGHQVVRDGGTVATAVLPLPIGRGDFSPSPLQASQPRGPISSSVLPLVSGTKRATKTMVTRHIAA